jgi:hypothetical protein
MYDDDVVARVYCSGATLHVHDEELSITWNDVDVPHLHRLPLEGPAACGDRCPLDLVRTLTEAQLDALWDDTRTVHCPSTISGTDTDTWHIEYCGVPEYVEPWDEDGELAVGCIVGGTNADLIHFLC